MGASASYEAGEVLVAVLGAGAFLAVTAFGAAIFRAALFAGEAFLLAFLDFAQRARCAAAILSRPAALMVRRFVGFSAKSAGLKLVALLGSAAAAGRPRFRVPMGLIPINRAFACWRRAISASSSTTMSFRFMNPPRLRIAYR